MNNEEVKKLIAEQLPDAEIHAEGSDCALCVTVISEQFIGLNQVKRQQMIYRCLSDHITSGALHAVTLKTLTAAEASQQA
ncbi:MAG: BolA/IbaG family iron-sulfur metabolism protein [Gammaproteobacteria bacterium]|nr:BolA/IbaG family iron-sulfur metabolism protein [Gammaproteobacteria bacterium]MCP4473639.1 BolA/IbaG family iron-sulfur metabolism protein [Gammaproteobacteria bacterium]